MTTANKITNIDMVARAKDLLLSQFKNKTNINKIVEALIEQVQELDNALIDLQEIRRLDNAYGIYLDNIGEKLRVQRTTLDDNDYRTAIKVRMLKNKSAGTLADVQEIIELLTFGFPVYIENTHPYVIELSCYLGCLNTPEGLELIKDLFPVNIAVRVQNVTTTPFGFAGNPNASGFGDANNVGGQLASLISTDYGVTKDSRFQVRMTQPISGDTPSVSGIPVLLSPPQITPVEDVVEGTILSCTTGTWYSLISVSYAYQWYRTSGPIVGATTLNYTTTSADLGGTLYCEVTASNLEGNAISTSNVVSVSEDVPEVPTVVNNLGLDTFYFERTFTDTFGESTLTFNTDGTFTYASSSTTVIEPFLLTTGSGTSSGYEIQYYTSSGQPFNSPLQNVWLPLTTPQTFSMFVNRTDRDRGGEQVFLLRRISDQVVTQGVTFVSVSCDSTDLIP